MEIPASFIEDILTYVEGTCGKNRFYNHCIAFFSHLQEYLSSINSEYSNTLTEEWIENSGFSTEICKHYSRANRYLTDLYEHGEILFVHKHMPLSLAFENVIAEYLDYASSTFSEKHIRNIKFRCMFFCRFLQYECHYKSFSEITYDDIFELNTRYLTQLIPASTSMYKSSIAKFLKWLSDKGLCSIGFSILLEFDRWAKVMNAREKTDTVFSDIDSVTRHQSYKDFPPSEFLEAAGQFSNEIISLGYENSMIYASQFTFEMLFVFLDMYELGFTPEIAIMWFDAVANDFFRGNVAMTRRSLYLFVAYTEDGSVDAERTFTYKKKQADYLPEWCRSTISDFLVLKKREGKQVSTVTMYRSSVTRFCTFLCKNGITDFSQLTPELISEFNLKDPHSTVDGKNAYNVRIRIFIDYLAETGTIDNPHLSDALLCVSAPSVRIVSTFSADEVTKLCAYEDADDAALGLRDRSILLFGLKMGLRASDIAALKLSEIDWENCCINFVQQKTKVGKTLPMPDDVANALFVYITSGRPKCKSEYVFVTHEAPYKPITRSALRRIVLRALPERKDQGAGFHLTRKTFATTRFRNDCNFSDVADLLGHSSLDTVSKYISLDEERMNMCPFSLQSAGIPFPGGFRYE